MRGEERQDRYLIKPFRLWGCQMFMKAFSICWSAAFSLVLALVVSLCAGIFCLTADLNEVHQANCMVHDELLHQGDGKETM